MAKAREIKKRIPILTGEKSSHIMTDMTVRRTDNTTKIELYIEGAESEIVSAAALECDYITLTFISKLSERGS